MSFPGRLNIYTCDECKGRMVTVDSAHPGDTTYFIHCQLTVARVESPDVRIIEKCGGRSVSSLYEVPQTMLKPRFEWYRPRDAELPSLSGWDRWKVSQGLLLLRPLEPA